MILNKVFLEIEAIGLIFVNYISYISSREYLMGCGHIFFSPTYTTPKYSPEPQMRPMGTCLSRQSYLLQETGLL